MGKPQGLWSQFFRRFGGSQPKREPKPLESWEGNPHSKYVALEIVGDSAVPRVYQVGE